MPRRLKLKSALNHQELLCYLHRILSVWSTICDGKKELMQLVDSKTVKALESRAPRTSTEDASYVRTAMKSGALFPLIHDTRTREKLKENILSIKWLIPTLYTFCEDSKYLEAIASSMKLLIDLEPKRVNQPKESVDLAFERIYNTPTSPTVLQDSETSFSQVESEDVNRFRSSLLQLYLKCMRSFPQLVNIACRKDNDEAKPSVTEPNSIVLYELATLAAKLGFSSRQIQEFSANNPHIKEIQICLARLEPNHQETEQSYLDSDAEAHLNLWHQQKGRRMDSDTLDPTPTFVTEVEDQKIPFRCGRPFHDAHKRDRKFLFMRWIYNSEHQCGRYITSLFVKASIFTAFFGDSIAESDPPPSERPQVASEKQAPSELRETANESVHETSTPHQPSVTKNQTLFESSTTADILSDYGPEVDSLNKEGNVSLRNVSRKYLTRLYRIETL